jgi:hypothetical protein
LVAIGAGLIGALTGSQQQTVQLLPIMGQARLPLDVASPGLDAEHSLTNDSAATITMKAIVTSR